MENTFIIKTPPLYIFCATNSLRAQQIRKPLDEIHCSFFFFHDTEIHVSAMQYGSLRSHAAMSETWIYADKVCSFFKKVKR
jgi:hypothetical protein